MLAGLADVLTADSAMLRVRVRVSLDQLITLLVSLLALVLAFGYQFLLHLPQSWRASLLGDSAPKE